MSSRKMKPAIKFIIIFLIIGISFFMFLKFKSVIIPKQKETKSILTPKMDKGVDSTIFSDKEDAPTLKIIVNTWGGFIGGQYFNNGFDANKDSRFYKDYGFLVQYIKSDDLVNSKNAWIKGDADLMWTTVDSFVSQIESIKQYKPIILKQEDWSRGGDSIVVGFEINTVKELKGKKIAYAVGSPSNSLLLSTLKTANMEITDIEKVETADAVIAASMFKSGKVDAAVVWNPDDLDCIKTRKGSKILISTKGNATHIIADAFYAKEEFIKKNRKIILGYLEGSLKGIAEINSTQEAKNKAIKILSVGLKITEQDSSTCLDNVRLCNYGDNKNFFGLNNSYTGIKGEDIYNEMHALYNAVNLSPDTIPLWREITDVSLLQEIHLEGKENEAEGSFSFNKPTQKEITKPAISNKAITINFAINSDLLDENAKLIIDIGFADIAKQFAAMRIRIIGHTDSTGKKDKNIILSTKRANAVANYLIDKYHFDINRFIVEGKGSNDPIDSNDTESGRAKNRRTEFQLL